MSESFELGAQLRDFVRGLLDMSGSVQGPPRQEWGPRVDLTGLPERYAPQTIEPFTVTPAGIDNLALHSTDVFTVPGRGEFTVDFDGYFRVARGRPSTDDWASCEVLVNIVDLRLYGRHDEIGDITASLNPNVLSSGLILPVAGRGEGAKKCRIAMPAVFDLPELGMTVFNKEPILLMNESVTSIPPVDDPNGHALLFYLPLYDHKNPDSGAVAYLTSLRYGADNYITEAEVRALKAGRPEVTG
jgi:Family of unknown function (DUF6073)